MAGGIDDDGFHTNKDQAVFHGLKPNTNSCFQRLVPSKCCVVGGSDGQRDPFTKSGTEMDFVTSCLIVHPVTLFSHQSSSDISGTHRLFKAIPPKSTLSCVLQLRPNSPGMICCRRRSVSAQRAVLQTAAQQNLKRVENNDVKNKSICSPL